MEITWLGHSCFRIKGKEATLVTDPYSEAIGYSLARVTANIVTLSHHHSGHNYVAGVEGDPRVVSRPGEYEISGVFIIGVKTFHDRDQGKSKGKNIAYLIEIDDVRLCHLGDLGHTLSPQQIEQLEGVEVLLIPVGGVSTINAKVAAEIVRLLSPRVVIPMHYRTKVVSWLEPVEEFLAKMGLKEVSPQAKVTVTKSSLSQETRVVMLDYLSH